MPENETLNPDTRTATRWRPLKERLDRGESAGDMFPELEGEFYGSLRRVLKQWRDRGVEPKDLFDAAVNNSEVLYRLIKRTGFDSYAQLLEDVVTSDPGANLEGLLCSWLNAIWESVRGQLQLDRHEESLSEDFRDRISRMLCRLLSGLSQDSPRVPPRPPRNTPSDIDDFLGIPLL